MNTETIDVTNMTESEINKVISGNAKPDEVFEMSVSVASQVVTMTHLSVSMMDWAWHTLDADIDENE